ncbi:MAG: MoaD/ThiS family protein [Verrucomicrobiales bacterium]
MPVVTFTPNLRRHLGVEGCEAEGGTVGEVLAAVFAQNPRARGYVLDDQGVVRNHMAIFVDGAAIADRLRLSDPVRPGGEIYIMQALSGG